MVAGGIVVASCRVGHGGVVCGSTLRTEATENVRPYLANESTLSLTMRDIDVSPWWPQVAKHEYARKGVDC